MSSRSQKAPKRRNPRLSRRKHPHLTQLVPDLTRVGGDSTLEKIEWEIITEINGLPEPFFNGKMRDSFIKRDCSPRNAVKFVLIRFPLSSIGSPGLCWNRLSRSRGDRDRLNSETGTKDSAGLLFIGARFWKLKMQNRRNPKGKEREFPRTWDREKRVGNVF